MSKTHKILCPKCGKEAKTTKTKYGPRNSCCDMWSWGKSPLVDERTHKARRAAHAAFDPIWRSKTLSRTKAYKWLAKELRLPRELCHMKLMDADTAYDVVDLCRNFKLKGNQNANCNQQGGQRTCPGPGKVPSVS
jgi:hypothetical protein